MEKIDNQIDLYGEDLANKIAEIKFIDIDQLKLSIATYFKLAMHDCLKINISELEKKLNQKKFAYVNFKGDSGFLQAEIIDLRAKIKERNVMKSQIEQNAKLGVLVKFLRENNPDILAKFFDFYQSGELPAPNTVIFNKKQ